MGSSAGWILWKRTPYRGPHVPARIRTSSACRAPHPADLVEITSLRDLSAIAPFLADLGARHARYGVCGEHYPVVGAALLETMAEVAGAAWQPEFSTEWARAYQMVAQIMIDGAERSVAAA